MIRALIFDCFGVLTNDGWLAFKERYFAADSEAARQASELNRQSDAGLMSHEEFVVELAKLANVKVEEVQQLVDGHVRNETLFAYIRDDLKSQYKIGLLSNAAADYTGQLFEDWQVRLFDEMTFSFELGVVKPDSRMYETIATKLGCLPEECVFIDDREGFVTGAVEVGMKGVWFKDNQQCRDELGALLEANRA